MTKMDRAAAARIQSNTCKSNNGTTPKGSFAARATSAAYKNEPLDNNSSSSNGNLLRACGLFAVTAAATGLVGAGYYFYQYLNNSNNI